MRELLEEMEIVYILIVEVLTQVRCQNSLNHNLKIAEFIVYPYTSMKPLLKQLRVRRTAEQYNLTQKQYLGSERKSLLTGS